MRLFLLIILSSCHCFFLWGQNTVVQRMNSNINTEAQEYSPIVTADEKTLIFNRLMTTNGFKNEDFYYSTRDSLGDWSKALPLKTLGVPSAQSFDSFF